MEPKCPSRSGPTAFRGKTPINYMGPAYGLHSQHLYVLWSAAFALYDRARTGLNDQRSLQVDRSNQRITLVNLQPSRDKESRPTVVERSSQSNVSRHSRPTVVTVVRQSSQSSNSRPTVVRQLSQSSNSCHSRPTVVTVV